MNRAQAMDRYAESPADRTSGFPLPPQNDRNPLKWGARKIALYGLPPKPDPVSQPRLRALWKKAFGQELNFVEYVAEALDLTRPPDESLPIGASAGHFQSSDNWSGAFLDAIADRTFFQIAAEWTIPFVEVPVGGTDTEYQCAQWIGLDGQRRYLESTLPQIGTVQDLKIAADKTVTQTNFAWTQWWARAESNTGPVPITGFPADSGDMIIAFLTVTGPHDVLCTLTNIRYRRHGRMDPRTADGTGVHRTTGLPRLQRCRFRHMPCGGCSREYNH